MSAVFSRKALVVLACGFGALVLLAGLALQIENWRGNHAWEQHRREMEARGEPLHWEAIVPPAVADDDNMAAAPPLAFLFEFTRARPGGPPRLRESQDARDLKAVSVSQSSERTRKAPAFGDVRQGTVTDLEQWRAFYLENDHYSLAAASASPARDVLAALAKYDDVLAELREAAKRPEARFPVRYQDNFSTLLPHLPVVRNLNALLHLRCVAHLELGQSAEAFEDLKLAFRLTDSIQREPILVSHLVRLALVQQVIQSVKEGLNRRQWTAEQLPFIQNWFAQMNLLAENKRAMRGERAFSLEAMTRLKREPWDRDLAHLVRFYPSGWIAQNKVTYSRLMQNSVIEGLDEQARRVSPDRIQLEEALEGMSRGPYTVFVRLLAPAVSKAVFRTVKAQTYVQFALVACALERYRQVEGEYPESLDRLVPRFLPKLPRDLLTGESLQYQPTASKQFELVANNWPPDSVSGLSRRDDHGDWIWQSSK